MGVKRDVPHPGRPFGLEPAKYCLFSKELPDKHTSSCGQCAAIQHAMVDAGDKAAEIARSMNITIVSDKIEKESRRDR